MQNKSCFNCSYLRKGTESWEMPHIWWYECLARPANEYLKHWPWKKTKCKHWKERKNDSKLKLPLMEDI